MELSPARRRIFEKREKWEKRGSKDWKEKEVKPQLKSSMFWEGKRNGGWDLQAVGRDSIERKKRDHIFL
jgi:hypothetical protein